jgi:hypothetical protein
MDCLVVEVAGQASGSAFDQGQLRSWLDGLACGGGGKRAAEPNFAGGGAGDRDHDAYRGGAILF